MTALYTLKMKIIVGSSIKSWFPSPTRRMLKYSESNLGRKRDLERAHQEGIRAKKAAVQATKRKQEAAAGTKGAESSKEEEEPGNKGTRRSTATSAATATTQATAAKKGAKLVGYS